MFYVTVWFGGLHGLLWVVFVLFGNFVLVLDLVVSVVMLDALCMFWFVLVSWLGDGLLVVWFGCFVIIFFRLTDLLFTWWLVRLGCCLLYLWFLKGWVYAGCLIFWVGGYCYVNSVGISFCFIVFGVLRLLAICVYLLLFSVCGLIACLIVGVFLTLLC